MVAAIAAAGWLALATALLTLRRAARDSPPNDVARPAHRAGVRASANPADGSIVLTASGKVSPRRRPRGPPSRTGASERNQISPLVCAGGAAAGGLRRHALSRKRHGVEAPMIPHDRLDRIRARFEYLEARLNAGAAVADLAALSREYAGLKPVVEEIARYRALLADRDEAERLRADPRCARSPTRSSSASPRRCPRPSRRCRWRSCPRTRPTTARRSSRSAPAPAARRRRCSPPTSRGCTSASPRPGAGAGRWSRRRRPSSAATASSSPR